MTDIILTIPETAIPACCECLQRTQEYVLGCRGCYVRSIARMSGAAKRRRYQRLAERYLRDEVTALTAEVTALCVGNPSWGSCE